MVAGKKSDGKKEADFRIGNEHGLASNILSMILLLLIIFFIRRKGLRSF
jgi:hypothetical protein